MIYDDYVKEHFGGIGLKNRYIRLFLLVFYDLTAVALALFLSSWICHANLFRGEEIGLILIDCLVLPACTIVFGYLFKCYQVIWHYARMNDYLKLAASIVAAVFCYGVVQYAVIEGFLLPFYITCTVLLGVFIGVPRLVLHRSLTNAFTQKDKHFDSAIKGNVMVIGGGSAGCAIIKDINNNNKKSDCAVRCVIDDDASKHGSYIYGAKIVGGRNEIVRAAQEYDIDLIVFAIPTCTLEEKSAFLRICQETNCKVQIVPSLYQFLLEDEEIDYSVVRDVEIEDLLGREPIKINLEIVMNYVEGKVVMVTGGGGSIGSELCRQIAAHSPKQLIVFDVYENNAYDIQNELKHNYPDLNLVVLIGSVRDSNRLNCVFKKYRPQIVYHAAAHKHVPLMETSPNETIKNNVFGTFKTAQCADRYGVERFVLISTDKAVNPTNIMGASKRICEMIVQYFNGRSNTDYVAVRFGNVLGSNGSVIPLFKKQIMEGGPVTVTDRRIIRYFMTIPEAVSLVLQAGASAKGGEIFVLDMGEPVKILDLAENLIRLSGFVPYKDIQIEFTGLRPGEKLYEELLMSEEGLQQTDNKLIFIGQPIDMDEQVLEQTLDEMKTIMYDDSADIRALVSRLVPTYRYKKDAADETSKPSAERDTITVGTV